MPTLNTNQLLEQLEKLKNDKETTEVSYDSIVDEDDSSASEIREKIAELMAANNTLLSLSLRWTYLHKRVCRELVVYTENQQIKIKLINGDNTFYPGEFFVPGFYEVDGIETDDKNEPVLTQVVAVYDRSTLQKHLTTSNLSMFKQINSCSDGPSSAESKRAPEPR